MPDSFVFGDNAQLVIVSILISVLASYIAIHLAGSAAVPQSRIRVIGLLSGVVVMTLGIWSMHLMSTLGFRRPMLESYDALSVLLISIVPTGVASGLALFLVSRPIVDRVQLLGGSLLMGLGITSMHYIALAAMCPAAIQGELRWVIRSGLISFATTGIAGAVLMLGLVFLTTFSDRRRSAEMLYAQAGQENRTYLATILQGIEVGVMVIEDAQVQLFNRAVLDLLHLSTETELQHLWDRAAIDPQTLSPHDSEAPIFASIQLVLQKIIAKQQVQNAIVYVTTPDRQEPTAILVNAVPLKLSNSSVTQMVCTFNEVTELKQTENRLKDSETKFRDVAIQAELLNYISTQIRQSLDLPTILQTAVSEVRRLFAVERALIYQFDADWRGQVILEDVAESWAPTVGEAADNCFPRECLERYRDGGIKAIHNVLEAGLDAEHRHFLQRLQVQANLIVPIIVGQELWGLLIVHQCICPRRWTEEEGNLLYRVASQLGIAIQQSGLYAQAEQSALQAQAQAQQLRASEAQLKQQTQALQQTLKELRSLQLQMIQTEKMSSLGQLVAGIAHEINNPVNFIHGNLSHLGTYAQELIDFVRLYQHYYPEPVPAIQAAADKIDLEFLQDDLAKILASMKIGTDRICQIVLSLRSFSRMDEAEFKTVDIHEGIDSTLMILQHRLKASRERPGIEMFQDYAHLPRVECYPGQLNQVFMNILTNAIDALEERSAEQSAQERGAYLGRLIIRTSRVDHQWIEIAIADNGPGIPQDVKERIFDPFFTTRSIGKGTGMGLSISYQIIVEKHGGKLECRSIPNQGTEFLIQIPIRQQTAQSINTKLGNGSQLAR